MQFVNAYAFTRAGQRVVIDMGLPYHEAVQRCEYEAAFIESMGDTLTHIGDHWYDSTQSARVVMYEVKADPFLSPFYRGNNSKLVWLPDSSEL